MDLGLMFLMFPLSIVWNVGVGLLVSVIISPLLVLRRLSKPRMTILGRIGGADACNDGSMGQHVAMKPLVPVLSCELARAICDAISSPTTTVTVTRPRSFVYGTTMWVWRGGVHGAQAMRDAAQ